MKIRTGFISNSSSSSFITVYIPDNFDFDAHMESNLNKYKKSKWSLNLLKRFTGNDFSFFKRRGRSQEGRGEKFTELTLFLQNFIIDEQTMDEEEGNSIISMVRDNEINKNTREKLIKFVKDEIEKYGDKARKRKERREILKHFTKDIDPYGEEDWVDDLEELEENYKIKKFKEYED